MDIIQKLKKEKKAESVFDSLIKKKAPKEEPTKPMDMEVRDMSPDKVVPEKPVADVKEKPRTREFRTEGMHEFDIESLGESGDASAKIEYKARVIALMDDEKFDEAIEVLKEFKAKLAKK